MDGPEERGPHRREGRGRGDVRAWCMRKMGGTLDWSVRAFGLSELRADPGRQGGEVMCGGRVLKSLTYNYQTWLRASAEGGFGPLRPRASAALPAAKIMRE